MYTDPIADLLTRIRNAQHGRRTSVVIPFSQLKKAICEVLKRHNFIVNFEVTKGEAANQQNITVELDPKRHPLTLNRVSSPGQRIYVGSTEIKSVKAGLGISVISTSKGVMTGYEASRKNLGGEILCEIY
jgi:small subunit ribosomal protein S8